MYHYKFYYWLKASELIKICRTEKEAEIFFDILVASHTPFKVYTLKVKNR